MKLLSAQQVELFTLVATDSESISKFRRSEDILINKLGIVEKFHKELNGPLFYQLHSVFRESLVKFLSYGMEPIFEINSSKMQKCLDQKSAFENKLNQHAVEGWTSLYSTMLDGFMFSRVEASMELTDNMMSTLENAEMILKIANSHTKGFDFLLDSIKNQVQILLYSYVKYLYKIKNKYRDEDNKDISEGKILNLILNITLLLPAMSYSMKKSFENFKLQHLPQGIIQDILKDLDCVGLIRAKQNEEGNITAFATTPLIHNILSGNTALQQQFKNNIIVETDFKIYAYTSNNQFLQALLNLFTTIKSKFSGLLVCSLKEDKIMEAFSRGINPNQILRYLNSNVHSKVVEKKMFEMNEEEIENIELSYGYIPENIVQQMFIWYQAYQGDSK